MKFKGLNISLKPCPFCGGDATIEISPLRGYEPEQEVEIVCLNEDCGVHTNVTVYTLHYDSDVQKALEDAVRIWNERKYHE